MDAAQAIIWMQENLVGFCETLDERESHKYRMVYLDEKGNTKEVYGCDMIDCVTIASKTV